MADDPVTWISGHIRAGIDLREECWSIRAKAEAEAWHKRELQWAKEALEGVAARSRRDVARVEVVDQIDVPTLPPGHPWWEAPTGGIGVSSTGVGRPGNNPFSCHVARINVLNKIGEEWRVALPSVPKLASVEVDLGEFEEWYYARAEAHAAAGKRSPRTKDRDEAMVHFNCTIPWKWINDVRATLPARHPFRKRGKPPAA